MAKLLCTLFVVHKKEPSSDSGAERAPQGAGRGTMAGGGGQQEKTRGEASGFSFKS